MVLSAGKEGALSARVRWVLTAAVLIGGCAGLLQSGRPLPHFTKLLTLEPDKEWRFDPLVVDLNGDGHLDLVATARAAAPALHVWLGDGKGGFTAVRPTWTDVGYAALATGDINGDGFPDIVAASHSKKVQTLLSDGRGGFIEQILAREDGYVAAGLADLNEDGHLDLILVGYQRAGIEIYFGDGRGNWTLHTTLPEKRPGAIMPGRALAVGDLNHDGHLDLVVAFQRWGLYIYYGDGRGGFTGGPVDVAPPPRDIKSVALGDVNRDGHLDIVLNATPLVGEAAGPDVYLGDGRGGWKASSAGLKVLKAPWRGLALADLDQDGNLDIVAAGSATGVLRSGYGVFWFRGDGKGTWRLLNESGLPTQGVVAPDGIAVADIDHDGSPEIIALTGQRTGITIWRRDKL